MGYSVFPAPVASSATTTVWKLLGRSTSNASSYSFTGLGGYKTLKLVYSGFGVANGGYQWIMRLNNNVDSVYSMGGYTHTNSSYNTALNYPLNDHFNLCGRGQGISSGAAGGASYALIEKADATDSGKFITSIFNGPTGPGQSHIEHLGMFNSTTPITSMQLNYTGGTIDQTSYNSCIEVWGAN